MYRTVFKNENIIVLAKKGGLKNPLFFKFKLLIS